MRPLLTGQADCGKHPTSRHFYQRLLYQEMTHVPTLSQLGPGAHVHRPNVSGYGCHQEHLLPESQQKDCVASTWGIGWYPRPPGSITDTLGREGPVLQGLG